MVVTSAHAADDSKNQSKGGGNEEETIIVETVYFYTFMGFADNDTLFTGIWGRETGEATDAGMGTLCRGKHDRKGIHSGNRQAGYSVIIEFHAWDKAMAIAARGDADGVFPAYKEKSREMNFLFSNPFAESPLGLCRRKYFQTQSPTGISEKTGLNIQFTTDPRIDETQALKELSKYSFGIVKGYANTPAFDAAIFRPRRLRKAIQITSPGCCGVRWTSLLSTGTWPGIFW
jgi:hypothetical protein